MRYFEHFFGFFGIFDDIFCGIYFGIFTFKARNQLKRSQNSEGSEGRLVKPLYE